MLFLAKNKNFSSPSSALTWVAWIFVALAGICIFVLMGRLFLESLTPPYHVWQPYVIHMIEFTLFQAVVSAMLCVGLATLFLVTLKRIQQSWLGEFLQDFMQIPFFMPSIVGCLGLILVFGQNGFVSFIANLFGIEYQTFIYGVGGILLCNVFYYAPLVIQAYLRVLSYMPLENDKHVDLFHIKGWSYFYWILWPFVKKEALKIFPQITLYCLRSFTTVLIFAGTPAQATIEVGIFQALNFYGNPHFAFQLALVHFGMSALFSLPMLFQREDKHQASAKLIYQHRAPYQFSFVSGVFVLMCLILFVAPLLALFLKGVFASSNLDMSFFEAAKKSLYVTLGMGTCASIFSLCLGFSLVHLSYQLKLNPSKLGYIISHIPNLVANISLIFSPLIIGIFLEIFAHHQQKKELYTFFIIVILNVLTLLPITYRILDYPYQSIKARYDKSCALLNIRGITRFFLIEGVLLLAPMIQVVASCFVYCLGDSRFILFFHNGSFSTLTLLLYDKMRAYEFGNAALIASFIIFLGWGIFFLSRRLLTRSVL